MADNVDLKPMPAGRSRTIKIVVRDKENNNVGVDVTGDKFYFTMKEYPEMEDADAELQVSVTAPANANSQAGIVALQITSGQTVGVATGNYFYEIVWNSIVSNPGGSEVVQSGMVSVPPTITRATT